MQFPVHIVATGGFVENKHGEVLLVKDRRSGWVFPGGQVEVGENIMDGLVREIKEESGIEVTLSHLIGVYSNTATYECRWVSKDEALKMISAPAIRTRYQAYLDFEGSIQYAEYITKPEFELKMNRKV